MAKKQLQSPVINTCPKCKSENIAYGLMVPDGDYVYYEAECNDCGCRFKEWYALVFEESITDDEYEVEEND